MRILTLPVGLGTVDFSDWFRGLVAGFIQGGAGAVTSGLTAGAMDPAKYNLSDGIGHMARLMLAVFVVNGILGAAAFLTQNPVPGKEGA